MSWIVWILWTCLFALFETWALINRRKGDTLSENTRKLFRIRTSKTGRAAFTVGWLGFSGWFLLHILTETM
ncbi:hypothetical protein [Streptomyces sp. 11x1]|uniref:hypothetical protein n=1 Tax=Streptomyces sp. 11x1 TaxID=3038642 RepID=UPI002931EF2A|nr:hypothetical protein [Streptomyces sp. 11x1]WNZ14964.1 hypothetical protein P8T65_46860 [Streptomyces sp. 11x1]